MNILVTGAAGFIGYHTCKRLLENGHRVLGLDNVNDYYNPQLKWDRLKELGIQCPLDLWGELIESTNWPHKFRFIRVNLEDTSKISSLFEEESFDIVCHLAAQAGVRYSLENPDVYVQSNIVGFLNILEGCRKSKVAHLVYASSSSVYGNTDSIPFKEEDRVDKPISLYAATKASNELMAHTYSHLFELPTTGLRFFTVYGPWGRPDMALFLFTDAIINDRPIKVFNNGEMARDFTYIDDIVDGVVKVIESNIEENNAYRLYNIGNNQPIELKEFIGVLEHCLDKKAQQIHKPMQPGDVPQTWANVDSLMKDFNYKPSTPIVQGVQKFVKWYINYYQDQAN